MYYDSFGGFRILIKGHFDAKRLCGLDMGI